MGTTGSETLLRRLSVWLEEALRSDEVSHTGDDRWVLTVLVRPTEIILRIEKPEDCHDENAELSNAKITEQGNVVKPEEATAIHKARSNKRYLFSWLEILGVLHLKNTRRNRAVVRRANERYDGPIRFRGKGCQPMADEAELIDWYDHLDDRKRELDERRGNREATVEASYPYGRGATVLPEIKGHIKKRRSDWDANGRARPSSNLSGDH